MHYFLFLSGAATIMVIEIAYYLCIVLCFLIYWFSDDLLLFFEFTIWNTSPCWLSSSCQMYWCSDTWNLNKLGTEVKSLLPTEALININLILLSAEVRCLFFSDTCYPNTKIICPLILISLLWWLQYMPCLFIILAEIN